MIETMPADLDSSLTCLTALALPLSQQSSAQWRIGKKPICTIRTHKLHEVFPCLEEVERTAKEQGYTAVGWVSAEAAAAFEPALQTALHDEMNEHSTDFPLLHFSFYDTLEHSHAPQPPSSPVSFSWKAQTTRQDYETAIARIRELIAAGETYQTNYTIRLETDFFEDPFIYFAQLLNAQHTEYAGFLDTPDWAILSVSPELFFSRIDSKITTRPMKGTIHRGQTPEEDQTLREWLRNSEKNRAENIMIVDLLRNDLGRVARVGSVTVSELCRIETYPTLHTMTSTIEAESDASLAEIFTALFPCGSVTGAPKIRTSQIIHELEQSPRRVYCGAFGVIESSGNAIFNVPIRTVLVDKNQKKAYYGVGGGITWDSAAADEYAEILTKARVLGGSIEH